MTFDEAIGHAARILLVAEGETNLAMQQGSVNVADSWVQIAALVHQRESV